MTSSERIGLLMFRHLRRELSASEVKELNTWRYAHPDNERSFLTATDPEFIRLGIKRLYETKERVYNRLLEKFPESFLEPPIKKTSRVYRILRYAASVVAVLGYSLYSLLTPLVIETEDLLAGTNLVGLFDEKGVAQILGDFNRGRLTGWAGITLESDGKGGYIYYAHSGDQAAPDLYYKLFTAPNGQLDLRLPDGSRIFLNGNSTIRYPRNLSQDTIKIFIEGEAWVELPKTKHQVLIFIRNTRIEAVGAGFDAEAYPDDSLNHITMVAGSARLVYNPKDSLQRTIVQLNAGREAIATHKKIEVTEARDTSSTVSWKNGRIYFTNAGIQTIMQSIEHGYGVHVEYRRKITDQKFSLDLPRKTKLRDVLLRLKSQGLNYSIRENTIIIQ
jgi:transmembrane sensor